MARGVTFNPNSSSGPDWVKDFGGRESLMPWPAQLDPAQWADDLGERVTVTAIAALAATTIAVAALPVLLRAGTSLSFDAGEFARVAVDAPKGATSITVDALVNALEVNDFALLPRAGKKTVLSGRLAGRTLAERNAGTPFGPWVVTDAEGYLVYFTVHDLYDDPDCEFYRPGRAVAENYLPDYATLTADQLTFLRNNYLCEVAEGG